MNIKKLVKEYIQEWNMDHILTVFKKNDTNSSMIVITLEWIFMVLLMDRKDELPFTLGIPYGLLGCTASLLVMLSVYLHPLNVTKMDYLCPMSNKERRRNKCEKYLLNVGIVFAIWLIFDVFQLLLTRKSLYLIILSILIQLATSLCQVCDRMNQKNTIMRTGFLTGMVFNLFLGLMFVIGEVELVVSSIFLVVYIPIFVFAFRAVLRELGIKENYEEAMK